MPGLSPQAAELADAGPQISIVFPLVDDRGAGVEAFAAWLTQDSAPGSYELIVVDGRRNLPLADAVKQRLRPGDRWVEIDSANEAKLYNAGAAAASSALIFFTESHVLPRPDVVREVLRHFQSSSDDAAAVASSHSSRNRVALLDECLFEQELPEVLRAEPWRWVSLRSFAVKRQVFQDYGPFDVDCRRFAETVFGLRLRDAGRRIGWIETTRLAHVNIQTFSNMAEDLRNCAIGQAAFRERATTEQLTSLGSFAHHEERLLGNPRIAASLLVAGLITLTRDLFRRGCGRRNRKIASQLPLLVVMLLLGTRAPWLFAVLKAHLRGLMLHCRLWWNAGRSREEMKPLLPGFFRTRVAWTKVGQWEHLLRTGLQPPRQVWEDSGEAPVDSIPAAALLGFLPLESWRGQDCRWSSPFASVRIACQPFDGWMALRCDTSISARERGVRIFWNGRLKSLADVRQEGEWLRVRVAAAECRVAEQLLTLACVPQRPSERSGEDRRRLGIALYGMRVEKTVFAAIRGPASRDVAGTWMRPRRRRDRRASGQDVREAGRPLTGRS